MRGGQYRHRMDICWYWSLEREEEYISNDENPNEQSLSQILYPDVNGLYTHIMANCKLPYKLIKYQDIEHCED